MIDTKCDYYVLLLYYVIIKYKWHEINNIILTFFFLHKKMDLDRITVLYALLK